MDRKDMVKCIDTIIKKKNDFLNTLSSPDIIFIQSDIRTLHAIRDFILNAPEPDDVRRLVEAIKNYIGRGRDGTRISLSLWKEQARELEEALAPFDGESGEVKP